MSFSGTRVTTALGIEYPIIQGPFGRGYSSVSLLSKISNAGGLGSFGANNLSSEEIRILIGEIRTQTNKPFNINLWVKDHDDSGLSPSVEQFNRVLELLKPYFEELGAPLPNYPERFGQRFELQVEEILRLSPPVFSFVFGIPDQEILTECRCRQIVTIGAATTVDEVVALDDARVDMIVASGFEAGGHRPSFLRPAEESLMGTIALVPQAVENSRVPIIAAGGDCRPTRHQSCLGAWRRRGTN